LIFDFGFWLLAFGFWLLAFGFWLLAFDLLLMFVFGVQGSPWRERKGASPVNHLWLSYLENRSNRLNNYEIGCYEML